ncbi:MAG: hypothetical protein COV45_04335 [Deltaproteobacteria bacterium CG11_big_fil_rev_8_21_14_0_20_47_16]|nr:MAG: hypothetical protein COV45_04335 [Deltaproteobacteria bacterium CG11_big_fil_rev_8_21_14_0_20_47_16]
MYSILIAFLVLLSNIALGNSQPIRVALVQNAPYLTMTGHNFYCYLPTATATERTQTPLQAAIIRHTGAGFLLNERLVMGNTLECISGEGILSINDIPTQGQVRLLADGHKRLEVVETLPMDLYLIGVMQGEVGHNWPIEALKAQAIASRSYAMAVAKERHYAPFDVAITTRDQVYDPRIKIPANIQAAVLDTSNQILVYRGKTLKAFYHSCCGGAGESFSAVAKDLSPESKAPFPPAVTRDPFCHEAPAAHWKAEFSDAQVIGVLQSRLPGLSSLDQIHFNTERNGRVESVKLATRDHRTIQMTGNQFRKALGYETVKSTWFTAKKHRHSLTLTGRGYGHGVGMCQWGAHGMAEKGKTSTQILSFYYPGAKIVTN